MNRVVNVFRASIAIAKASKQESACSLLRLPSKGQSYRCYSQQNGKIENLKDRVKLRRAYALGGCFIFMWLGTHGILLYRRRTEHRALDKKLPPIPLEEFLEKYVTSGQVKSIVYQPTFGTGNVYLSLEDLPADNEQKMIKTVKETFHISPPDKFSRRPDVRFFFEGDQQQLEQIISDAQKTMAKTGNVIQDIEFSIDQFPSKRELAFILISSLFTFGAIALVK